MQRDLDHDLNQEEKLKLDEHLSHCSECPALFERLRQLSNDLAMLPKVSPPFSLVDRIMPQLVAIETQKVEEAVEPSVPSRKLTDKVFRSMYMRVIGGAAAAILIFIMAWHNMPFNTSHTAHNAALNMLSLGGQSSNESAADVHVEEAMPAREHAEEAKVVAKQQMNQDDAVANNQPSSTELMDTNVPPPNNGDASDMDQDQSFQFSSQSSDTNVMMRNTSKVDEVNGLGIENEYSGYVQGTMSPNETYTAYIIENELQFRIVVVDEHGEEIYSSRQFEADDVFNIHWTDDSKSVQFETLKNGKITKSTVSVK